MGPPFVTSALILVAMAVNIRGVALGAPELQCGKYKDAPAICNDRTQFFSYSGKNKFDKAADWLQPPG